MFVKFSPRKHESYDRVCLLGACHSLSVGSQHGDGNVTFKRNCFDKGEWKALSWHTREAATIILQQFHYFPIWIQENLVVTMRHRCKWTENVTILVHRSLCHLHTNYFRYCGVNFSSESSDNHQLLWNVKGNLLFTRIWKLLMIFLGKSVSILRVLRHTQSPAPGAVCCKYLVHNMMLWQCDQRRLYG